MVVCIDVSEDAPTQLSVSPPASPLTSSPIPSAASHIRGGPFMVRPPRLSQTSGGPSVALLPGMSVMPPISSKDPPLFLGSSSLQGNAAKHPGSVLLSHPRSSGHLSKTMPKPKCGPSEPVPSCSSVDNGAKKKAPALNDKSTDLVIAPKNVAKQPQKLSPDTNSHLSSSSAKEEPANMGGSDETVPKEVVNEQTANVAQEVSKCNEQTSVKETLKFNELTETINSEGDQEPCHLSDDTSQANSQKPRPKEGDVSQSDSQSAPEVPIPDQGATSVPFVPHLVPCNVINHPSVPHPVSAQPHPVPPHPGLQHPVPPHPVNTAIRYPANTPAAVRPPFMHPMAFTQPPPMPARMPFSVPSYPWLAITSPHLSNMAGPINFNVMPSSDPSGSDLPHTGIYTTFRINYSMNFLKIDLAPLSQYLSCT